MLYSQFLTHVYVSKHRVRFSAKYFSLENLPLLTNSQKLSTV